MNGKNVLIEMRLLLELLRADFAFEWSNVRMNLLDVSASGVGAFEGVITKCALERFHLRVDRFRVLVEDGILAKALVAQLAFVQFFA